MRLATRRALCAFAEVTLWLLAKEGEWRTARVCEVWVKPCGDKRDTPLVPGTAPAALDVRFQLHPAAAHEVCAISQAAKKYGSVAELLALACCPCAKEDGAALDGCGLPTAVARRPSALTGVAGVRAELASVDGAEESAAGAGLTQQVDGECVDGFASPKR